MQLFIVLASEAKSQISMASFLSSYFVSIYGTIILPMTQALKNLSETYWMILTYL